MSETNPRILIVDDDPDMGWGLENILRPAGYAVTTTTSGTEALELATGNSYDMVFIDAKLPDLDGLELATLIHEKDPRTTIILVSGYFYEEDKTITEGLKTGLFAGFVAKPFNIEEIRRVARQALGRAGETR